MPGKNSSTEETNPKTSLITQFGFLVPNNKMKCVVLTIMGYWTSGRQGNHFMVYSYGSNLRNTSA